MSTSPAVLAPHGAILQVEGARGVHLGVKQGRSPGVQLGYAQVVNPLYLVRKQAGYPMGRALSHIGCNMAANLLRALRPEPWVDRRGRLRGNLQALADLLRGRLEPERMLACAAPGRRSERPPIPAAAHNPSWRQAGPALAPRQVPLALDAHADTEPAGRTLSGVRCGHAGRKYRVNTGPRSSMSPKTALVNHAPDPVHTLEPLGVPMRRLGAILRRRAWLVLLVLALGLGGMGGYLARAPATYRAEASVLVEPRRTQVSDLQAISADPGNANLIRTQIDILRSPALARRVVEELGLVDHPAFQPHPGLSARLLRMATSILGLAPSEPPPEPTEQERIENAADALSNMVGLQNEARSNLIFIWAETTSAELSADIANQLARQYLEFKQRQKTAAMQRAHTWFSDRLEGLAEKTRESEQLVENSIGCRTGLPRPPACAVRRSRPPSTASSSTRRHGSSSSCPVSGPARNSQLAQARAGLRAQQGPEITARGAELADRAAAARPGSGADCAGGGARLLARRSLARPAGHPRAAPRPAAAAAGRDGECHDRPGQ